MSLHLASSSGWSTRCSSSSACSGMRLQIALRLCAILLGGMRLMIDKAASIGSRFGGSGGVVALGDHLGHPAHGARLGLSLRRRESWLALRAGIARRAAVLNAAPGALVFAAVAKNYSANVLETAANSRAPRGCCPQNAGFFLL